MKHINTLLKTMRLIDQLVDRRRDRIKSIKAKLQVSDLRIKILPITEAYTDDKGYSYPQHIDVKIENWSNRWYSFRLSDGVFIPEGCDLNGKGVSALTVIKRMVREYQSYIDTVEFSIEASENNCVVFNGSLIVVENVPFDDIHSEAVYELVFEDGSTSRWYGYSPAEALRNASPFIKQTPVLMRMEQGA